MLQSETDSSDSINVVQFSARHGTRIKWRLCRGQATVEVILAAVISVIVILGLVYRFNQAFRQYTIDLYGNYYRCLLEAGELPGSGGACSNSQVAYSVANGRALVVERSLSGATNGAPGSSGRGSNGGTGGENGADGASGSGANGESNAPATGESVVGSGGPGGGNPAGRVSASPMGRPRSTQVGSVDPKDSDKETEGELKGSNLTAASRNFAPSSSRRARTQTGYYIVEEENESDSLPVTAVPGAVEKAKDRDDPLRPRRAEEKMDRKPASKSKDLEEGKFEFGKIIRMLLIFLLIAAVVFFFASQALQISKSAEK